MADSKSRSFLTHAVIYGAGTVLLQAASIVLLPLYTRYLTPAEFGVLEILSRTGAILGVFLMANGVATATFAFYCQAKSSEERQRTAATVTVFLAVVLLGGSLLVAVFARPLGAFIGIDSPALTTVGIVAALLECATVIPLALAQARTESIYIVSVALTMFVCRVAVITLAVVAFGLGIWGILGASIFTCILFAIILHVREFWKTPFRPDLALMREVARFALPFVPGGLCLFVLSSGDRFFLVRCAGQEEMGIYSLGYKLALAVGSFSFGPLFKVWSARMYEAFALPNAATVVGRAFTRMLAAYVFVGLGLCMFIDNVLVILASPAYAHAAAVVAPLVLAGLFSSAGTLMDGAFYAFRRTDLKPWIALVAMLVMCGLYAWLIPQFGAMGAAYAAVAGYAFLTAATFVVSQHVFAVKYEAGRLAAMLGLAAVLIVASGWLGDTWYALLPKAALLMAWPAVLWISGMVTDDEKALCLAEASKMAGRFRRVLAGRLAVPAAHTVLPAERIESPSETS